MSDELEFYCIARDDGLVPCDVQCYACFKTVEKLLAKEDNLKDK